MFVNAVRTIACNHNNELLMIFRMLITCHAKYQSLSKQLLLPSTIILSGVQISRYIANFGDRDIHLAIDATDSGDCPMDSKNSTCA